jgi:DNA-directed RNA polymerase specialized sigma24 family protein
VSRRKIDATTAVHSDVEILAPLEVRRPAPTQLVRKAVERAQAGDWSARDYLYVRFADDVRDELQTILGDIQAAEDLTQSVFFGALSTPLQSYEPAEAPFHTWILNRARDAALDRVGLGQTAL